MNAINRLRYELRSYYGIPYIDVGNERVKLANCDLLITQRHDADLLDIWDTYSIAPTPSEFKGKTVQQVIMMIIEHVGL